jgi:DNA mismatch repair protein MSH2
MKEKGDLILRRSRHPCLEQMISNISILGEKEIVVVANDLNIKEKEGKVHIITGPNMGGKSTFIRQVGINVLMAHIGCFVAADYACIPIIDSIITRVGASDV